MRRTVGIKILSFGLVLFFTLWSISPQWAGESSLVVMGSDYCSAPVKNDYCFKTPEIIAESLAVMDAHSRSLLFSKGSDTIRGMASTTKIMTALVALENGNLNRDFQIPQEAVGVEGSSVYLSLGEPLTLRELLYCLLLESGNDAATAIAICVGGSEEKFVEMMNQRAAEMGLTLTHFTNPHGLSDENHYTTAHELALITAEAMEYPLFREIVATKSYRVRKNGEENKRILNNHNKLLGSYEGAIGVKTGYTIRDGKCLVSAATRDGLTLIVVTLKDNYPVGNHKILLDLAFDSFSAVKIASAGDISVSLPVENGVADFVTIQNTEDITLCLPKGAEFEISLSLPESLKAPLRSGEVIGEARVYCDGKEVYIINLEVTEDVKIKEKSFWQRLFGE